MNPREMIAWIVAATAIAVITVQTTTRPKWTILNSDRGIYRIDCRTGETQRMVRDGWRDITTVGNQPPFDPDKYLAVPPATAP